MWHSYSDTTDFLFFKFELFLSFLKALIKLLLLQVLVVVLLVYDPLSVGWRILVLILCNIGHWKLRVHVLTSPGKVLLLHEIWMHSLGIKANAWIDSYWYSIWY